VFLVDPQPGARSQQLTITSSSKDNPIFGADGRVYYLASGQLVATAPGTSDADAVFPSADLRLKLGPLLSTGGLRYAMPSPDGKYVASVLRLERGEALLLSPRDEPVPLLLVATGETIEPAWLPDNTLITLIRGGSPAGEPVPLLDAARLSNPQAFVPSLPPAPEQEDSNLMARFAASDGKLMSVLGLSLPPSGFAVSPDGKRVAIAVEEGSQAGVAVLEFGGSGGGGQRVFTQPASSPTWSPDGKMLAFVSNRDIFTVTPAATPPDAGAEGAEPPVPKATNLTKGQGSNSSPVWSPARARAAITAK